MYNNLVKGVLMTADNLKRGIPAVITAIKGEKVFKRRLESLGVTIGASVIFLRTAPFGDPIIFAIKDIRVAIRKTDAKSISVKYDKRNWTKKIFV